MRNELVPLTYIHVSIIYQIMKFKILTTIACLILSMSISAQYKPEGFKLKETRVGELNFKYWTDYDKLSGSTFGYGFYTDAFFTQHMPLFGMNASLQWNYLFKGGHEVGFEAGTSRYGFADDVYDFQNASQWPIRATGRLVLRRWDVPDRMHQILVSHESDTNFYLRRMIKTTAMFSLSGSAYNYEFSSKGYKIGGLLSYHLPFQYTLPDWVSATEIQTTEAGLYLTVDYLPTLQQVKGIEIQLTSRSRGMNVNHWDVNQQHYNLGLMSRTFHLGVRQLGFREGMMVTCGWSRGLESTLSNISF